MKIFQTMLDTALGPFWISATHESGKIQSLSAYPIEGGIVQQKIPFGMEDLPDLVAKLEGIMAEENI